MKTLLFCNLIPRKTGAHEALIAAIGAAFRKAGDEFVVVFSGEPIPPVAESLCGAGIKWHVMTGWVVPPDSRAANRGEKVREWHFVLPALRLIRHERPDVVVVQFGNELPALVASLLCRVMMWWSRLFSSSIRSPRWVWAQDQRIQDPGRISRWISKIRLLGLGVDRFLAVYEGGRQSMLKRGIPANKITAILNGIAPYSPFRKKGWLREELGIGPHEVILVTNGSLIPRKRIDFLLQVCADLKKTEEKKIEQKHAKAAKPLRQAGSTGLTTGQGREEKCINMDVQDIQDGKVDSSIPKASCTSCLSMLDPYLRTSRSSVQTLNSSGWCLLVIGDGPERQRLVALSEELGINDRIRFLGLRNDVREILAESDIYLHAARAEACSYAIIESMAAGIPAVVLNAGAAREQIVDGVSGYVFDEADTGPFAACSVALMADTALRMAMGRRAQARWASSFHLSRVASQYHAMYNDLATCRTA
jgi:glycosyltransferase involved in cell wall biosynthesis